MKNTTLECGTIPKGTKVKIMGCSITLLDDVKVDANQADLDCIIKEQDNFYKGIGVVGSAIKSIDAQNVNSVNDAQILEKLRVLSSFASSHLCEGFNDFRSKVEAKAEELIDRL